MPIGGGPKTGQAAAATVSPFVGYCSSCAAMQKLRVRAAFAASLAVLVLRDEQKEE